ncbi:MULTISPECIES: hypothetical protein [Brevibacterium]|uniref:Uncharacterized protein n=2 Tax=Brevibacterium TaxID=1696 RepID=A0A0B9ARP4_BRELN|nr:MULTISPECIES: hypothetical protein [Brevibacterium]AMT94374.1 hypothetical protein A2T55_11790 [Brevibacterium linens]KHS52038.1 hypothetical protein AE0388_2588 [Brevibacterium linens]HJE78015.1 hypothetical protein [Brevibacterium epidermidis]
MTDFHYFAVPTATDPGTLNPVYELLDFPIAMGKAEDIVLTGPAPEKPLVDGREVTDPRLIKALSVPVELDRAEVLDRSSKLAGVLRAMGVVPESGAKLTIAEDVPPLARALGLLAAARVGLVVDLRAGSGGATSGAGAGVGADSDQNTVVLHSIEAEPIEPGRASVRVTRSRFEGVGVTIGSETANLDQAMRDSRVEFAAVVPLAPDHTLLLTDDGEITAGSSLDWYRNEVLSAS